MEADWSVALAAEDPVITVPWEGPGDGRHKCRFLDLRRDARLIEEIEEARQRPALVSALLLLNGAGSPFWTAKCGTWVSGVEQGDAPLDPFELDAEPGRTNFGAGSYIDLLACDGLICQRFEVQESWLRAVTEKLRGARAPAARVELVLRRAQVNDLAGFAVSWFVEGCGPTADCAEQMWSQALDRALAILMGTRLT